MTLDNKTVLVTGGAGFFGKNFTKMLLAEHAPKSVRVYDNRELALVEMEQELNDDRARFLFGDVRDKSRLYRAMNGVDVVVHAAALKHVPVCEYSPIEAVNTNIDGARNVIDAAIDNNVERVLALSTDKAVYPVNLYGSTKFVAEKLFVQANSYATGKKTKFSCSRYGNVVGSSGSVVPVFEKQKQQGEIQITDERMTRFWITLEDGIRFVIQSIDDMEGGEIFVPKIPSMKVTDLADVVAPNVKRRIIGIRPGEKLHETLITKEEATRTRTFNEYYVVEPEFPFWDEQKVNSGERLSGEFTFSSDVNDHWITKEELEKIITTYRSTNGYE